MLSTTAPFELNCTCKGPADQEFLQAAPDESREHPEASHFVSHTIHHRLWKASPGKRALSTTRTQFFTERDQSTHSRAETFHVKHRSHSFTAPHPSLRASRRSLLMTAFQWNDQCPTAPSAAESPAAQARKAESTHQQREGKCESRRIVAQQRSRVL